MAKHLQTRSNFISSQTQSSAGPSSFLQHSGRIKSSTLTVHIPAQIAAFVPSSRRRRLRRWHPNRPAMQAAGGQPGGPKVSQWQRERTPEALKISRDRVLPRDGRLPGTWVAPRLISGVVQHQLRSGDISQQAVKRRCSRSSSPRQGHRTASPHGRRHRCCNTAPAGYKPEGAETKGIAPRRGSDISPRPWCP